MPREMFIILMMITIRCSPSGGNSSLQATRIQSLFAFVFVFFKEFTVILRLRHLFFINQ